MTEQSALDILKHPQSGDTSDIKEAIECAVNALKKQIPIKPNIHGYREGREVNTISFTCPMCNKHIGRDDYCKHCGQKLLWEE